MAVKAFCYHLANSASKSAAHLIDGENVEDNERRLDEILQESNLSVDSQSVSSGPFFTPHCLSESKSWLKMLSFSKWVLKTAKPV